MRYRNRLLLIVTITMCLLLLGSGSVFADTYYTVQPGDTVYWIAQDYGVPMEALASCNGVWDLIYPGEVLIIPDSDTAITTYAASAMAGTWADDAYADTWADDAYTDTWADDAYTDTAAAYYTTSGDVDLLARLIYSEARGESYVGQVAVGAVALNRLYSGRFGSTLSEVIFEPWAFTATHDGQFWYTPDSTAYQAAMDALSGWDPTGGATYYFNPATATSPWIWSRTITGQIGNHLFGF